jgi:hypothetical protein
MRQQFRVRCSGWLRSACWLQPTHLITVTAAAGLQAESEGPTAASGALRSMRGRRLEQLLAATAAAAAIAAAAAAADVQPLVDCPCQGLGMAAKDPLQPVVRCAARVGGD